MMQMKLVVLLLFTVLTLVYSWAPPRPHVIAPCISRRTVLAALDRPPAAESETQESFFFRSKDSSKSQMKSQMEYLEHSSNEKKIIEGDEKSPELVAAGVIAGLVTVGAAVSMANNMDVSSSDIISSVQSVFQDPQAALQAVVEKVEAMGSVGVLYFAVAYTIAEILAIPAIPLTASAGYLFGPVEGTTVVLFSASIAAAVSFVIGRTLLRDYVESVLEEYPKFAKIDRAIGKEGFKLMLLLRLSPIFPFALSNYLYGASSINFSAFFFGTLFGFAPGTLAYVYTGYVGKALTDGGDSAYPWFVYAGGLAIFAGLLKVVADTATRIVEEMEDEDADFVGR